MAMVLHARQPGAIFRFLGLRQRDRYTTALFRANSDTAGIDYKEFYLLKGPGDAVRVVDLFAYAVGETVSRMQACMHGRGGKTGTMLKELNALVHSGHGREALEAYAALPPEVRRSRVFLAARLQAAKLGGDDAYTEALDDFAKLYPKDPVRALVNVDRHYSRGDFARARRSVDELDRMVGGDPYLNVLRANAYVAEGNLPAARKAAEAAVAGEPDMPKTHWTLVDVALLQRDFAEVARTLTRMESEVGVVLRALQMNPAFADFGASPEGLAWLARDAADAK